MHLCSPLDGKPSVADLEDDPIADYVVSAGPLRKLQQTLTVRFTPPRMEPRSTTKPHSGSTYRLVQPGTIAFSSMKSAPPCTLDLIVGATEVMNSRVWRRHDQIPLHPVQPIPRGSAPHRSARRKSLRAQPARPARPSAQTAGGRRAPFLTWRPPEKRSRPWMRSFPGCKGAHL